MIYFLSARAQTIKMCVPDQRELNCSGSSCVIFSWAIRCSLSAGIIFRFYFFRARATNVFCLSVLVYIKCMHVCYAVEAQVGPAGSQVSRAPIFGRTSNKATRFSNEKREKTTACFPFSEVIVNGNCAQNHFRTPQRKPRKGIQKLFLAHTLCAPGFINQRDETLQ